MPGRIQKMLTLSLSFAALWLSGAAFAQTTPIQTTPTTQPGSAPPSRRLTLADAVNVALRNSKTLQVSAEGVYRAQGRVSEQRAGFLPTVNATGTVTHLDEGSTVT